MDWPGACSIDGMVTENDYYYLANNMIRLHGVTALLWADLAIADLESQGEDESADHWRTLREVIGDLVSTGDTAEEELMLN